MQKPWLRNYPPGVPGEISLDGHGTLVDMMNEACRRHADRPALTLLGCDLSYADLDRHARSVAAWLQQQGLEPGDRVALMMPNVMSYMPILLGVLRAGMVAVNMNPLYSGRELHHQLDDSSPMVIFVLENFAHTLAAVPAEALPRHVVLVSTGDLMGWKGTGIDFALRHLKKLVPPHGLPDTLRFSAVLRAGARAPFEPPQLVLDDVAVLQYTGGTTGAPKGAMLTQGNLLANVLQVKAVAKPALGDLSGPALTIMSALPLYHIFALTVCGLFAMHAGMRNVLIINPRDLSSIVQAWRAHPVHILPAVNTLFNGLLNRSDFTALDFSALRLCFGGGAAVQRAVAERWHEATGRPLIEGYGLSETSPVVCVNPTNATEFSGNIGFPVPSTDVVMLDNLDRVVATGEPGELSVRGPQVMKGYWRRPQETADAFSPDGYFRTGDVGVFDDDGRIRIVDRKKDMILVSGFNVYPNEVEEVIASHPDVLECAVIGLPHPHSGEMIKVYVVRKNDGLTEQVLQEWCRERLAAYKRPHAIEFREDLPKSNVGKILRRVLRDEAMPAAGPPIEA